MSAPYDQDDPTGDNTPPHGITREFCPASDGEHLCSLHRWHTGEHVHLADSRGTQIRFGSRPPTCPKGCPRDEFAGALVCRHPYTCPMGDQQ